MLQPASLTPVSPEPAQSVAETIVRLCASLSAKPGDRAATMGLAEALYTLGARRPAAATLTDLIARNPDDAGLCRAVGKLAERTRDWPVLIMARRRVADLAPDDANAAAALGRALRDGGRPEEAAAVLADAFDRFPDSPGVWSQKAHLALTRGDLRGARAGWAEVAKLLPGNTNAANWLVRLDGQIAQVEDGVPAIPRAIRETTPELVGILDAVTSLGQNCEVGFLQRFYGSEPIGMFRWARVSTKHLLAATRERFAGFGTAGQMRLEERDGRYFIVDTRFDIRSHTGVHTQHEVPDNLLEREGRKQRKLRDLLLHQMQTGTKLFVHQAPVLPDANIRALTDAMRAIGPVTVLFVRLATEPGEVGQIEEREDGVFVACIDRLGTDGPAGYDPSELWVRFCTTAHRSFVARSAAATPSPEAREHAA